MPIQVPVDIPPSSLDSSAVGEADGSAVGVGEAEADGDGDSVAGSLGDGLTGFAPGAAALSLSTGAGCSPLSSSSIQRSILPSL